MLTDAPFQPSLAVADLERSRAWYADKLGWQPIHQDKATTDYKVGEAFFGLYESQYAGTAKNTVMNWSVADVRAELPRLRERGIEFLEYDFGDYRTVDGIMTDPESGGMNAWFKDPDGNIVGVISAGTGGPPLTPATEISGMLAASDLDRATAWYAEKLGMEPDFSFPDVLATYKSGPSMFTVYKTEFAGTAKNTVGLWRLQGVREEVDRLRGRGVVFEEYNLGEWGKTVDGIMVDPEGNDAAWFKDSEGNILSLVEDRG